MAAVVRVFDGDHLRAELVRRGGATLCVTFDYRRLDRAGFGPLSPSRQIAAAGHDQLMIATRGNDWFINPDTPALEAVCRPLRASYGAARALGFSMGGYGAFRFSRTLNLGHVVAVSPQVSIAPDMVPFDRRYRQEGRLFDSALGDLTALHDPALQGAILCDSLNLLDLTHARMLQVLFPALRLIRLPGGGHPCTQVLRAISRTGLIQRLALGEAAAAGALQQAHRQARGQSAGYWTALGRAAAARRPDLAAAAGWRAANLAAADTGRVDEDGDSA
ncbi:alpha/beta hydrolase [Loktanella sp. M215]|uniref:alpha/beta hydrolase n=1 Tax=Loktanella sp. M215 TaxID=2675431 RepID=UPI001F1B4827|nr:alpha/beta hydrolase [Loktanella sp. M215]MCF7701137.1 alpha/beta hydrolase [Loktanella sp. M215]